MTADDYKRALDAAWNYTFKGEEEPSPEKLVAQLAAEGLVIVEVPLGITYDYTGFPK